MVSRTRILAIAGAALAMGLAGAGWAQDGQSDGDWPEYNRTVAGDRFCPLRQINTANVAHLALQWSYQLPAVGSFQTGPIVVDGTMYFTTDLNSYAVDARNCQLKWMQHRA